MNLFNSLSIKSKFLLLFLTFIIPLLYFVTINIYDELEKQNNLVQLKNRLDEVATLTSLVHELQMERVLSQGYFSSEGRYYKNQLDAQQMLVDKKINQFQKLIKERDSDLSGNVSIDKLPEYRKEVAILEADSLYIIESYSSVVESLLDDLAYVSENIQNPSITDQFNSLVYLSGSKENLAQIRSIVTAALSNDSLDRKSYGGFSLNKGSFDLYLKQFHEDASNEILKVYQENFSGSDVQKTLGAINRLNDSARIEAVDLTTQEWVEVSTGSVNDLRQVEQKAMTILNNNLASMITAAKWRVVIYVTFLIGIFAITVILATYIIRLITSSIYEIRDAANRINTGDTDIRLQIKTKDELADLGRSFNILADRNYKLSLVADAIGRGDYETDVEVRSEKDLLGIALLKMKNNLLELSERDKKRNYVLSGNDQLNDLMRSEKNLNIFSKKIIQHLCSYLNLQLGAFYIMEEDNTLRLTTGYGFKKDDDEEVIIPVGEGLVGQAAETCESVYLTDIPENYLKVKTTFLNEKPSAVYVIPLMFQQECHGVIELAGIHELTKLEKDYLESILEKIAIVLINIKADIKTNELLLETQNQAEEMEAQQEELRQINDELREQSLRLQASEEELRASQEELQEKNAELEEKANQLEEQYESIRLKNVQLEEARTSIQEKVEQLKLTGRYRSEFLANMSHELRTPLNSVLILAKLLGENKNQNLTEKQVEFANIIHKSGSDLLTLINEILDLSKIEAGKINLKVEEFSLNQLDLYMQFKQLAEQSKIQYEVNYDDSLPATMVTDKFRLEQVLKNLLSNAFKFTPENGKVSLDVKAAPKDYVYSNDNLNNNDVIEFSVTDSGIGISKEKQKLIFEAFQQADASTSRKYGGTGLGLSISREIIGILGGEMALESEEGKGSKFSVFLPVKYNKEGATDITDTLTQKKFDEVPKVSTPEPGESKTPSPVPEPETKELPEPNKKPGERVILIVEDDKNFVEILKGYATDKQFKPVVAYTGKEAISLARKYKPDAILLDVFLPEMNGWDVLRQIKAEPKLASIPVHIISAADEEETGKKLGAVSFVKKPVTTETLESIFNETINATNAKIRKTLIIEDNKQQNESLKELLESRGHSSDSVYSGKEAIEQISSQTYDCVILDLNLPDINGFNLLKEVKSKAENKAIPFIIYSGRDLSREEEEGLRKYTNAIIVKTAQSYDRLLDEVNLFLHNVEDRLSKDKEVEPKRLHPEEVLKGKKVLLVDDDIRNIYALYNVFESHELEIVTAGDGKEALKKLEENPDVDVVLMDIMMPEMDGYETMQHIRKNDQFRLLPIIALTAKAMKGDREKCIQAGASDYISKPIDIERLLSLMRVWLYDKN